MALFGEGSFLANRIAYPEAYEGMNFTVSEDGVPDPINAGECLDLVPLGLLFADPNGVTDVGSGFNLDLCINNVANGGWTRGPYAQDLSLYMLDWVENFTDDQDRLANVFTATGFVANRGCSPRPFFLLPDCLGSCATPT